MRDKTAHILDKYRNANLLVAGDNRYLSDDLMRLMAVIVQPVSGYAYKVLMAETMSGAVFYAPKPAYEPNDMYTLLRNPHIARNEEVIAKPMEVGPLRQRYKTIQQKSDSRKWYQPTKKQWIDTFFGSVDWESVSSNLEKLPYYAKVLEEDSASLTVIPAKDEQLFGFATDPDWKDKLDPNLMMRMEQLISAYEEVQRRCRNLGIEPDRMARKNEILRILYARNQENDYTLDELYHCFDHEFPGTIRKLRHELTEGGWMFSKSDERIDFFDRMPMASIRYWDLFCDFRCGGYRLLPDIICDYDDLYSSQENKKWLLDRKGDSEDMRYLMRGIDKEGNYKETLIRRCHQILRPYAGAYAEAAKCAIAMGKRQFALEVFPSTVLDLALDIYKEEKPRKRKWRWPWDAERD